MGVNLKGLDGPIYGFFEHHDMVLNRAKILYAKHYRSFQAPRSYPVAEFTSEELWLKAPERCHVAFMYISWWELYGNKKGAA